MVSFEVDRAGVVLVGDGEDDGDANQQQVPPPLRPADSISSVSQAAALAAAAVAPTTSALSSSSAQSFRLRRHLPPSGAASNALGDNSDADKSIPVHHRAQSLIRITVPRVGIRACSTPLPTTARTSGGGGGKEVDAAVSGGERHGHPEGARRAGDDAFGLVVTVTAESLEGHLEMDDPGTSIVPMSPPTPSTTVRHICPHPPFDEADVRDGSGVAVRETHCLRWLAIRKVSFSTGAAVATSRDAKNLNSQNSAGRVPTSAQNMSGGRPGNSGSASPPFSSGTEEAVGDDGLAMEGLWAEWSPVLFFLAGKSGAMVRICTVPGTRYQVYDIGHGVGAIASMFKWSRQSTTGGLHYLLVRGLIFLQGEASKHFWNAC